MKAKKSTGNGISRREFGRLGALALVSLGSSSALATAARAADDDRPVTEYPENAAVLAGVQYVAVSTQEGQHCSNCMLYSDPKDGTGKCVLFPKGRVAENGWCVSWSPKAAAAP